MPHCVALLGDSAISNLVLQQETLSELSARFQAKVYIYRKLVTVVWYASQMNVKLPGLCDTSLILDAMLQFS